jgi:dihydrofolate reductase
MVFWETADTGPDQRPVSRDYTQIWRAADKVVYSRTLEEVSSARTRIERTFDVDTVRQLVSAADRDVSVGGAGLAAVAIRGGLVDEYHQFLAPVLVGGGKRALPDDVRIDLELVDERRFAGGFVHLHHRARR